MIRCPGCGASYPADAIGLGGHDRLRSCDACWLTHGEVTSYVMDHPGLLGDWHQTNVDAYALQHLAPRTPTIAAAFALNGLYLVLEQRWTGVQARAAHIHLARTVDSWPVFSRPDDVGPVAVADVRTTTPEQCAADLAAWGRSVWDAWEHVHEQIAEMTDRQLEGWHRPITR